MNRVLEELAGSGIFGKNKSEVAGSILWKWVWDNEEKLLRQGVRIATNP